MGPPQGGHPPVQIVAHGQFLTGCLRVEVHQGEVRRVSLQQPVRRREGVVRPPGQVAPADQVQHPDPDAAQVVNTAAPTRGPAGVVGGPQQPGRGLQEIRNLALAEGVVPQGHHVGTGVVDPLRLVAGQPHSGGILAVHHREVDGLPLLEGTQVPLQMAEAGLHHHVAHCQNVIQHSAPPVFTI